MTQSLVVSWPGAATPGPHFFGVPPAASADFTSFLEWCVRSARDDDDDEITVVITDDFHGVLGLPETPEGAGALFDVEGWDHGPAGPWITFWCSGIRVHLGIWRWIARRPRDHALFTHLILDERLSHQPCGPILVQLEGWRQLTGLPYRGIPGIAGIALLRHLVGRRKGRAPLWHTNPPISANEPEIGSWRSPTAWDLTTAAGETRLHPHSYDANRAYLAAAGCAEVAADKLVNTGPIDFNPARAGWWLINADPWNHTTMLPDPLYQRTTGRRKGSAVTWATTPTVKLLADLAPEGTGVPGFTVLDSWTGKGTRLFRSWAGCLNNACTTLINLPAGQQSASTRAQLAAAKDAYRQAIGLMNHEGGAIWRPDWHYTVIAQARATLWRKLWTIGSLHGRWPVAISTDAVTYASCYPNSEESENPGFPLGTKLGEWKIKRNVVIR